MTVLVVMQQCEYPLHTQRGYSRLMDLTSHSEWPLIDRQLAVRALASRR